MFLSKFECKIVAVFVVQFCVMTMTTISGLLCSRSLLGQQHGAVGSVVHEVGVNPCDGSLLGLRTYEPANLISEGCLKNYILFQYEFLGQINLYCIKTILKITKVSLIVHSNFDNFNLSHPEPTRLFSVPFPCLVQSLA